MDRRKPVIGKRLSDGDGGEGMAMVAMVVDKALFRFCRSRLPRVAMVVAAGVIGRAHMSAGAGAYARAPACPYTRTRARALSILSTLGKEKKRKGNYVARVW